MLRGGDSAHSNKGMTTRSKVTTRSGKRCDGAHIDDWYEAYIKHCVTEQRDNEETANSKKLTGEAVCSDNICGMTVHVALAVTMRYWDLNATQIEES